MQTVNRLLDQFSPNSYELSIVLDRPARLFSGTATIHGTTSVQADAIKLHAKNLTVQSVTVNGESASFSYSDSDELHITAARQAAFKPAKYIIVIGYTGAITDAMHGMYPCYFEHEGVKKELLATQFESHHAREVFPCIDEPAAKTTFSLTLSTEPDVTVLSNTDAEYQRLEKGRLVTKFEETPRMSTYLLAWVVGELQNMTTETDSGVRVSVWSTMAHDSKSLAFSLEVAKRSIEFFDEYFGVPYPLKKCDHVALPDFSSGAMENWGLITYREMALIADHATSISSKHYIATVIAHELSHMWFGNLVTMQWWDDLWLNESFATLMEYIAVDALYPQWNIWLDFATSETIMALRRDSIDGVQPVRVDVHHPDEISTLFDGAIVYAKGARLMRMLERYVGSDAFQKGLNSYFTSHAYGNTTGDDLWRALEAASGKEVSSLMNSWIQQPGYPVVRMERNGDTVTLSQEQFFIGPHKHLSATWPIPLGATAPDAPELFSSSSETFRAESADQAILLNEGGSAHYITDYDDALLVPLLKRVEDDSLTSVDKVSLLHEQILLSKAEAGNSASLLPVLNAYRYESTEPVWDMISLAVRELKKFVEGDDRSDAALRRFAGTTANEQYSRLGLSPRSNETENDAKLRVVIASLMLYSEEPSVIAEAHRLYSDDLESINAEIRPLILSAAVRHGNDGALIDRLLTMYPKTTSPELQRDIVAGVTSTRDVVRLTNLLDSIKEPALIRPQDAASWFAHIIRGQDGREVAWTWLKGNWEWIVATFRGDKSYDDFLQIAAGALVTDSHLREYRAFTGPLSSEPALARVIAMGEREIEARLALITRDRDSVRRALQELDKR